jgi:hypothetical protein
MECVAWGSDRSWRSKTAVSSAGAIRSRTGQGNRRSRRLTVHGITGGRGGLKSCSGKSFAAKAVETVAFDCLDLRGDERAAAFHGFCGKVGRGIAHVDIRPDDEKRSGEPECGAQQEHRLSIASGPFPSMTRRYRAALKRRSAGNLKFETNAVAPRNEGNSLFTVSAETGFAGPLQELDGASLKPALAVGAQGFSYQRPGVISWASGPGKDRKRAQRGPRKASVE